MKHFWQKLLMIVGSLSLLCCFSAQCADAVRQGLELCCERAIPALLPFFCVSSLAVECGLAQALGKFCAPLMRRVFHLPGVGASALVLGFLGGYPSGARTAGELYQAHACSREQAEALAMLCNNTGPAFLIGLCGGLCGSARWGVFLYGIHVLSALLVGFFLRPRTLPAAEDVRAAPSGAPLGDCLTQAIVHAGASCLQVSAFILFFSVVIRLAQVTGVLPCMAQGLAWLPLGLTADGAQSVLCGTLELTQGICRLNQIHSETVRLTAASFLCALGGCSVWFQSVSSTDCLCLRRCAAGKCAHACCAALLCRAALFLRTAHASVPVPQLVLFLLLCMAIFMMRTRTFMKNDWKRSRK